MKFTFMDAVKFNQDLNDWDVTSVSSATNFDNGASSWTASRKPSV